MGSEKIFFLIQQLKCLSKTSCLNYTYKHQLDLYSSIFAWFFEKTIDLVDGVIQLHKSNLDECGQVLIRTLFETYLKYIHFIKLRDSTSIEEASMFVLQSIYLTRGKDILEQDKIYPHYNLEKNFVDLKQFKEKHQTQLKKIKRNCFLVDSIETVSKKYHKNDEYQIMYRNFSSNVHTYDFAEYQIKRENRKNTAYTESHYIKAQKKQIFGFVFEIFIEMASYMNNFFELGITNELSEIKEEYRSL